MSADSDAGSSASRVKAFRSRLTGQYKRVEAYVTEDEKSAIEGVKASLGVTTDAAVAGLLRLGLERFEQERSTLRGSGLVVSGASAELAGASESALVALSAAQASSGFCSSQAAMSLPLPSTGSVLSASAPDNPIARFFKNRKETSR